MEVSFKKFELRERINSNLNVELSEKEAIEIAKNFSSINSKKGNFIRKLDMDLGNFSITNPTQRERISLYLDDNPFMNYHDTSPDWKDYPKRKHSLIFANYNAGFYDIAYYVVPLDKLFDLPIASTQRSDFNFTNITYKVKSGDEVTYYVHEYLKPDSKYYTPARRNKKKLTPEALGFDLFKYKDYVGSSNETLGRDSHEFYTEMPCMLIKINDLGKEVYDKIKIDNR